MFRRHIFESSKKKNNRQPPVEKRSTDSTTVVIAKNENIEKMSWVSRSQPFTLNTPDRHWIFAGDLCRVEGRSVRSYWALLFSDILLFTKVSRDRVLFVTDEPLPLSSIVRTQFSVKKKGTGCPPVVPAPARRRSVQFSVTHSRTNGFEVKLDYVRR